MAVNSCTADFHVDKLFRSCFYNLKGYRSQIAAIESKKWILLDSKCHKNLKLQILAFLGRYYFQINHFSVEEDWARIPKYIIPAYISLYITDTVLTAYKLQ